MVGSHLPTSTAAFPHQLLHHHYVSMAYYTSLPNEKFNENDDTGEESDCSLGGSKSSTFRKKRETRKKYLFYITLGLIIIVWPSLIVAMEHIIASRYDRSWDKFNYYCRMGAQDQASEIWKTDASSSGKRCSCSVPICPSTIQWLTVVSKPLQGPSNSRGREGVVRYYEM